MDVSVEVLNGLERRLKVQIPTDQVQRELEQRLQDLAGKVKLDGFRPGKVPLMLVKQRFAAAVHGEVVQDLIRSSLSEALEQQNLQPAHFPKMEVTRVDKDQPLEYVAVFEVLPQIQLQDCSSLQLERLQADVTEQDIENMLAKLQQQKVKWQSVERAAKLGDQIEFDFEGLLKGEAFQGNKAEHFKLELGSKKMIPGFEEKLAGLKKGDTFEFDITFPKEYHAAQLAGQEVRFKILVHQVEEAEKLPLNDEFAKEFGMESLEKLCGEIRANMERELKQAIKRKLRDHVLEEFLKLHHVELPTSLVEAEMNRIRKETEQMYPKVADAAHLLDAQKQEFESLAKRRVSLGLLIAEYVKANQIHADKERLREAIENAAAQYEQPEQVVSWYYRNEQQLAYMESMVVEEQVVEKILTSGAVVDKAVSYDEIMNQ